MIRDRQFINTNSKDSFKIILTFNWMNIAPNVPLTALAKTNYFKSKLSHGCVYTTFRNLKAEDIISILSAVKRQEAEINTERYGRIAYYKLNGKESDEN